VVSHKDKILNLEQCVDVIKQHDNGGSCRSVVRMLNVGKTQVQSILNDREKIMEMWESGENCERVSAKMRKTVNYKLNMYEFLCQVRSNNVHLTGKLLQEHSCLVKQLMYPLLRLVIGKKATSRFWTQTPTFQCTLKATE